MLNTWLILYCLLELEIEIESISRSNEKSIQEEEQHLLSVQKQDDVMAASAQVTDFSMAPMGNMMTASMKMSVAGDK